MEPPLTAYNDFKNYPRNSATRALAPYAMDTFARRLEEQSNRLFTNEAKAALDFLDLGNNAGGMSTN